MNLQLKLTRAQEKGLLELAGQFQQELEKHGFPKATTLDALRDELQKVLFEQAGFEEFWKDSEADHDKNVLCITHDKTEIRNLPWQIAMAERKHVAVAKTYLEKLKPHKITGGYPLKVLVMVSAPEGVTRLEYEQEELLLLRAFAPLMSKGLVQVHFTDDGSLEDLEAKLKENKYHILHYSGHGIYHEGKGYLALEDPVTGKDKFAKAEEINDLLRDMNKKDHRPDLVVLSACQTAQGQEAGDMAGVADTLLKGGVPAVIAMSASVFDSSAMEFAAELYAQLSQEYELPAAFQKARLAVKAWETKKNLNEKGLAPGQWLIPQLLLHDEVKQLIDTKAPKQELDFTRDIEFIKGEKGLLELQNRPKDYVFIGRRREKRQAFNALKSGQRVLLRGQGGLGKTALAEHLAIRLMAGNQNIKVFTHSEKQRSAKNLLDQMENYLTYEKEDYTIETELSERNKFKDKLLYILKKLRTYCDPVFLFDNVEDFQKDNEGKQTQQWNIEKYGDVLETLQLLDKAKNIPIIITGRYPILEIPDLEDCDLLSVPFSDFFRKCWQLQFSKLAKGLSKGELENAVPRRGDSSTTSFEDVAQLLHHTLGGNYRALEFFDELYVKRKKEILPLLGKLSKLEQKLKKDRTKDSVLYKMSENLIFEELLSFLNKEEKITLGLLAYYNIPVLPLALRMQRSLPHLEQSLTKLADLTLIEKQEGLDERTRYYVMPLVKDLLGTVKLPEVDFSALAAGDYHRDVVEEKLTLNWIGDYGEAFEWFYEAKEVEKINVVGKALCDFYYDLQQFRVALAYGLRTEEIAKDETDDWIWNALGLVLDILGEYDLALGYYEKSLAADRKKKDRKGEGATLNNLATIAHAKGDYDTALQYLEQSLKIRKEIGDKKGEGTTLNNISQIYDAKGDYDTALEYLKQTLKIVQEIGDRKNEGGTLNNISQIYDAKGDYDTALQYLEQSLKISKEIGDKKGESTTLGNIGSIYHAQGEYEKAIEYFKKDLTICQEIGDKAGQGTTLNNISQIQKARGDYGTALQYLEQSLKIRNEIGDISGEATTLNNIGGLLYDQEQYEQAIPKFLKVYQIFERIGSPNKKAPMNYLGLIIEKIGEQRFKEILEQLKGEEEDNEG